MKSGVQVHSFLKMLYNSLSKMRPMMEEIHKKTCIQAYKNRFSMHKNMIDILRGHIKEVEESVTKTSMEQLMRQMGTS